MQNWNFINSSYVFFHPSFFWWDWGLNLGFDACKAGTVPLEPHLQSSPFFSGDFGDGDLAKFLHQLVSNHDLPDLNLPSS
jgi:hypothetical protein